MPARYISLRQSFELVAPLADSMVEAFYRRLFELEPDLRSILPPGFVRERRKLIQRLHAAIGMLERPDMLVSALESLWHAKRGCGVSDEYYYTFAEALLWVLERGLGPVFTPEVQAAWISFCEVLITILKNAGETAQFELAEAVAC